MNTELTEISPTQREIKIEIEPAEVREVYNRVSQKFAKQAQIDGFRKGFAPLDIVRLRYQEQIRTEVLQELFSPKVGAAIQEYNLNPLSEPHLRLDDAENVKVNGSQPIRLHVSVEVMPEIAAPAYKNLEVVRRTRPLSDEEFDNIIDERRQESATLVPVEDRKSKEGDTLIVDLEGEFVGEETSEPIKADDLEIKLGAENIEKSFTENLVGVEPDEEKEFTVAYPADFTSPMLAGKTVNYRAKIKSVGEIELPALDDEWAASLDEGFESLEDLRKQLRADLEAGAKAEADNRLRGDLIQKLIDAHEIEVPNSFIETQARILLNNFAQDMQQRGMDLNNVGQDFVQMVYTQMQGQAERDVRGALLLEKVAEAEGVEISDEEVTEEIERIAQHYRTTAEQIRASLAQQQGGEANIANSLRTRKAVEALAANARITDGEWIDPNQPLVGEEEEKRSEGEEKKTKKPAKKTKAKKETETAATEKAKVEKKKTETKEPKKKAAKKAE